MEKFTELESGHLSDGLGILTRSGLLTVEDHNALLSKISADSPEKFTEVEYAILADGIAVIARRGLIGVQVYHNLLIKLASNRASADNKPEVLIKNVRYESYGSDAEIARGYALNHPRLGEQTVRTSLVVSKAADGSSFETLNTRYIIVKNPDDDSAVPSDPDVTLTVAVLNSKIPLSKIL